MALHLYFTNSFLKTFYIPKVCSEIFLEMCFEVLGKVLESVYNLERSNWIALKLPVNIFPYNVYIIPIIFCDN